MLILEEKQPCDDATFLQNRLKLNPGYGFKRENSRCLKCTALNHLIWHLANVPCFLSGVLFYNMLFFGRVSGTIYGNFTPTGTMKGGPRERHNHLTEQGWLQGFQSLTVFPNELRHCCLPLNS